MGQGTTREVEAGKGTMTHDPNVQTIENARLDDIQPGDHVTWEDVVEGRGVTIVERREGIAHHRDNDGDWCSEDRLFITAGEEEGVTITIRRTLNVLPSKPFTVIVPNDGHEYITATFGGVTYHAREAVLTRGGLWAGAWRSEESTRAWAESDQITADAWKVDDQ